MVGMRRKRSNKDLRELRDRARRHGLPRPTGWGIGGVTPISQHGRAKSSGIINPPPKVTRPPGQRPNRDLSKFGPK